MFRIGDKFINLVGNNRYAGFEIGDIITISGISTESKMPYFLTKENETQKGWWYTDETIKLFTIPCTNYQKELFIYRLTGNFPGRQTYIFGVGGLDWESIYIRGEL